VPILGFSSKIKRQLYFEDQSSKFNSGSLMLELGTYFWFQCENQFAALV